MNGSSPESKPILGLIAGGGDLPLLVCQGALRKGWKIKAFGMQGEANPDLEKAAGEFLWVTPENIPQVLQKFSSSGITKLILVGGINKIKWMESIPLNLPNHGDSHLLNHVADFFSAQGIQILDPIDFLEIKPPREGNLSGIPLSPNIENDLKFGFQMAKALGYYDIGQTVVVKNRVVLAVESVEGTDEAIRRGGRLGGPGAVVVKTAKPDQDLKIDRPVVGLNTVRALLEIRAAVLALEAEKVLFVNFEESVELARKERLAIVARTL